MSGSEMIAVDRETKDMVERVAYRAGKTPGEAVKDAMTLPIGFDQSVIDAAKQCEIWTTHGLPSPQMRVAVMDAMRIVSRAILARQSTQTTQPYKPDPETEASIVGDSGASEGHIGKVLAIGTMMLDGEQYFGAALDLGRAGVIGASRAGMLYSLVRLEVVSDE